MEIRLAAIICMFTMLVSQTAMAYSRGAQGYGEIEAQGEEAQAEADIDTGAGEQPPQDIQDEGEPPELPGMSGTVIGGYVLLTVGGLATIAGSTIITASDKNTLGAIVLGAGAATSLAGTLMIMLGSHSGYAVGPAVDPGSGTYGVVVAKRF